MSSEKRLVLCLVLTIASVYGLQTLMERTGLIVPPKPRPAPAVAKVDPARERDRERVRERERERARLAESDRPSLVAKKGELPADPFTPDVSPAAAAAAPQGGPKLAEESELVLGPDASVANSPYYLRLQLSQRGAVVDSAASTRFDAELDPAAPRNAKRPRLELIARNARSDAPSSLAITIASASNAARPPVADLDGDAAEPAGKLESPLDVRTWEVVRDRDGAPAVRTLTRVVPGTAAPVEGQEIAFRIRPKEMPALQVTKVFRLWQGQDGFEVDLKFASPAEDTRFAYHLYGPHGIPIEGEWYTSTFRDAFFGQTNGTATGTAITTQPSHDVVKYEFDPTQRISALPLKFAGIEDQYFATFVEPWPIPRTQDERRDVDAGAILVKKDEAAPQKSDIGIEIVSKPILAAPNLGEIVHSYKVFAGPKTLAALTPYEAEELASYRKTWLTIPGASWLAKNLISPLLDRIYAFTESVSRAFGGTKGNYGIAIILLTMTVRLIMFPIGRKQAMMAKKMQDLQPILAEVKEKYKDDKEALTRETMAVWKRNKVNPAAGCLPALIQIPIFTGLWQTLNNSVALRHSTFLYIRDLAAPDVLFQFPYGFEVPFLGKYFNLLPILVVSLMLVQTRLFAPPPTTPEAEMNQKMMKYMMVVMAVMFYKVPSGLGLYFITGSLWQIGERLLLPKLVAKPGKPAVDEDPFDDKGRGNGGGGGSGPNGNGNGNGRGGPGVQGWLGKKLEKLLEDAAKDKTIRNADRAPEPTTGRSIERDRPRPRSNKPPGKRR